MRAREQIVHEIVGRVVAHPDLFEDHLAFRVDVVGAERRAPQHVGEDVDRELELRVGHAHVEHGLLVRRERVHLAADRLDRLRDLAGADRRSVPLNSRCSRKWLAPDSRGRFVARAAPDPRADRHRPRGSGSASVTTRRPERESRPAYVVVGHAIRRRPAARAAAAGAAAAAAATRTAAIAAAIAAARRRPTSLLGRAEVAELLARLALPERLERRGLAAGAADSHRELDAAGLASARAGRTARARSRARGRVARAVAARAAAAAAAAVVVVTDERERELAVLVDVVDPHAQLVAERQHVFDPVDALALTELRDVDQPVAARKDVDERTELGDVDDAAFVDRADLGGRRVEDELDPALRLGDRGAVLRTDRDDADTVGVLHRDVGAGLLLDRVDDLALGPDHLADLVDRDLEADDLRCGLAHVVARRRRSRRA